MNLINHIDPLIESSFEDWESSYKGYTIVKMPPGWKDNLPVYYTFVFAENDLTAEKYAAFYKLSKKLNLKNPRLFTARVLELTSLFHPSFFLSLKNCNTGLPERLKCFLENLNPMTPNIGLSYDLGQKSIKIWLQSVAFLSGVTLSAAIIQNRWSIGTIESKLNRLWQIEYSAERFGVEEIKALGIKEFVLRLAPDIHTHPMKCLKELKSFYAVLLKKITTDITSETVLLCAKDLSTEQKEKFGFVSSLKSLLGENIIAIILYGSAVNSQTFSDYDLIVVVKNIDNALEILTQNEQKYNSLELNISVFDEADFRAYQLASGDNLSHHAICLFGEAMVPEKPLNDLIIRNFSFGFVRFRQLLGMATSIHDADNKADDKRNLLDYFIKIPLNVYKGIQGCYGKNGTNEELKLWFKNSIGYDVDEKRALVKTGHYIDSISKAAWATQEILFTYQNSLQIFSKVPIPNKEILPFQTPVNVDPPYETKA